jgi:cell wall-associated NlpC family hydrolase
VASPALADGGPATRGAHVAATRAKRGTEPKPRLTARERTKARSIAAAAHTKAAERRVAARPAPTEAERAASVAAAERAERLRDSVVRVVRAQIGVPYVLGGASPDDGFDCSGLVKYVMAALHVPVPRTAAQQAASGLAVTRDTTRLRPGDLLTFAKGTRGVSHIGIYIGNGRYVHASSVAGRVIESPIERPRSPLIKSWRGVRRVVATDPDSVLTADTKGDS